MKPSDKKDFAALLRDVMAYYRQDISPFVLELWWNACQPFAMEQISKAMQTHCTDAERGVFAPKVADVVRVLTGTVTDRAALAWGKVLDSMGYVGAYQDVVFDDPAIHAAIEDCGGWVKICRSQMDELSYLQHRFCLAHKAYTGRGQFEYQRRLNGDRSPDSEYEKKGLPLPRPALVGDVNVARAVYLGGNVSGKTTVSFIALDALESGPVILLYGEEKRMAA